MKDRLLLSFILGLMALLFTCACQRKPVPKAGENANHIQITVSSTIFAAV
jgi:hypothetical protein